MRRARYFAVVAVAVALPACGGGDTKPRPGDVEQKLTRIVEKRTGTRDVTVDCPEDASDGDVCEVTAPGGVRSKVTVEGKLVQP